VHAHASWAYSSDAERASAVTEWLREGIELGQRALYVGEGTTTELRNDLRDLEDRDRREAEGALVVLPHTSVYDLSAPIDPATQLAAYDQVVQHAIKDGYSGARVAADITPLVEDPARRTSHLAWEQYADRYIAEQPLAPMCLHDTRRVQGDDIDAIACVHARQRPGEPLFALYGTGAGRARLEGEIDGCNAPVLALALAAMPPTSRIDISGLEFLDGHGAWTLHTELTRRPHTTLTNPPPQVRRVWRLCGLDPSPLVG